MFQEEGYQLMGAGFEVYNQLGYGMAEEIYQQSLEIEPKLREIPFLAKPALYVTYKGHRLETLYRPDLIVHENIVVELKAVQFLLAEHEAQLFNYMRIARLPVGYLLNFGHRRTLQWKRYILTDLKEPEQSPEHEPLEKRLVAMSDY